MPYSTTKQIACALMIGAAMLASPLLALANDGGHEAPPDGPPHWIQADHHWRTHHDFSLMHEIRQLQLSPDQWKQIHDLDATFHPSQMLATEQSQTDARKHFDALLAILTPAQQLQLKHEIWNHRHHWHRHHHHHHDQMREALKSLNLTEAQWKLIREADEAFKKSLHSEPPIDKAAFEAHKKAIFAILTPDQQAKLQKAISDSRHQRRCGDERQWSRDIRQDEKPATESSPTSAK